MQVGRDQQGGQAVTVLTLDSAIPPAALAEIADVIDAETARTVDLSD